MLTDEDDSTRPTRSPVGGQFGYAFNAIDFPGSDVSRGSAAQGTTAPRGTSKCATNPADPSCTSCGFGATCDETGLCDLRRPCRSDRQLRPPAEPIAGCAAAQAARAYYGPADDDLNIRFFQHEGALQRRSAICARPLPRTASTARASPIAKPSTRSPSRRHRASRPIAPYTHLACKSRSSRRTFQPRPATSSATCRVAAHAFHAVLFGLLTGIPSDLGDSGNPNWAAITGNRPERLMTTRASTQRMVAVDHPARRPRRPTGTRRRSTSQYACTFERTTPLDCSGANSDIADALLRCNPQSPGTPPADSARRPTPTQQVLDKAYPAQRELRLARSIGRKRPACAIRLDLRAVEADITASFLTRFGTAAQAHRRAVTRGPAARR